MFFMTLSSAESVLAKLNAEYPHTADDMNFLKFRNPFELLIMTILSAQTTDVTINGLRDRLFDTYPTPSALAAARQEDVEEIIHSAGFYHTKAKNSIAAARKLCDDFGGEVPQTISELITLPGVGRKTANIVTNHAYHQTYGIAVDTHVARLSRRLGFSVETDPQKIEVDLMRLFDKKWWSHINYLLISHGRAVCMAKRPRCEECCIRDRCNEGRKCQ